MRTFALALALLAVLAATASASYASPLAGLKQASQFRERPSFERPLVREGLLLAKAKRAPQKNPLQKVGDGLKAAVASSKSFWMAAAAGGFAGTCMFPVDTAKVRMQACAQAEQAVAASLRTYRNTFQTLGKIVADEGFLSLYKGLLPVLVGSAPEMAVQVASYEAARDFLSDKFKKDKFSFEVQFASGCISGFTHVAASNPMEVLKIRGQVLGAAGGTLMNSIKQVGIKGLYKGVGACWSRDIPFSAIYFPTYAYTKKYLESKGVNEFACALMAGLVAGVAAATPTTPCDVVKTRLQNPKVTGMAYKGVRDCVTRMAAEEGLGSFFVGVGPRVGRVAPYLALSLTSYEIIKAGVTTLEKKVAAGTLFKPDPKAAAKRKQEEDRKRKEAEAKKNAEQAKRTAMEREAKKAAEAKEQKKKDAEKRAEADKKAKEEQKKKDAEAKNRAEADKKAEEGKKKAAEIKKKAAEIKKKAEETKRKAEEAKKKQGKK